MLTFCGLLKQTFFKKRKIFQEHFQIFKRFGSRSGSADLGPNCLHSTITGQDLQCLSDKIDFTTSCSTLNESSIFYYFLLLFLSADYSFSKLTFQTIFSGTLSVCQTVWIHIRTNGNAVLIWVPAVCFDKSHLEQK